jgi:hypothetical protein
MSEQNVVLEEPNALENSTDENEVSADVVNLSQSMANVVKAELVRINQGGAEKIVATEVEVRQGGANRVEAEKVSISQGGVGQVQTANFDLKEGGAGVVRTESLQMSQSGAGIVYSQTVDLKENSQAGLVFARQVSADHLTTKLLLAGNVEGQVETIMDTRQALLVGLSSGFVLGLMLLIGQLLSRRK